jgi:signal transduction histidine kinase
MMTAFAAHAALVLDMSALRDDADRLRALEDRERIAVDLQQIVIRNLFALGLSLQGLAGRTSRTDLRDGITAQVDEVDRIIRAIRESVFATEDDGSRSDG